MKRHEFKGAFAQSSCEVEGCGQLEDASIHSKEQPEDDPRKEVWRRVFQVISDCGYRDERELIKALKAAREQDRYEL